MGLRRQLVVLLLCLLVDAESANITRPKRSRELVFEYGQKAIYRWNEMYFEELAQKHDIVPQYSLTELGLSFFRSDPQLGTPDQVYGRAVANLQTAAPHLDILWLIGGYHFTPLQKTAAALQSELLDLVANIQAFTRHLSRTKWRLYSHTNEIPRDMNSIRYIFFAHMNDEFMNSGALIPLLYQILHHSTTRKEMNDRYFVTTNIWNGIKVYLELGIFTTTPSLHSIGRLKLLNGDQLFNAPAACIRNGNLNCGSSAANSV
ncbi:hypothetical protein M3Y98_00861600 [Aphelenchoides besseyi]|nr:hypothetical protein M3Y98_00861600 [Aphelenchoides besseyi]